MRSASSWLLGAASMLIVVGIHVPSRAGSVNENSALQALQQSTTESATTSGRRHGWWDIGIGSALGVLGGAGLVLAGNAADDRKVAEENASFYADQFLTHFAAAAEAYALGYYGTSDAQLAEASYWAGLGADQSAIIDDKNHEEGLWKGVAYTSFAVGGILIVKGLISLNSNNANERADGKPVGLMIAAYPQPVVGLRFSF